jgi:hypothetical protein
MKNYADAIDIIEKIIVGIYDTPVYRNKSMNEYEEWDIAIKIYNSVNSNIHSESDVITYIPTFLKQNNVSVRLRNVLMNLFNDYGKKDVLDISEKEFMSMRNAGKRTFEEYKRLSSIGFGKP